MMPNIVAALRSVPPELSTGERLLFLILLASDGRRPQQAVLATLAGSTVRSVRTWLRALESRGLIGNAETAANSTPVATTESVSAAPIWRARRKVVIDGQRFEKGQSITGVPNTRLQQLTQLVELVVRHEAADMSYGESNDA